MTYLGIGLATGLLMGAQKPAVAPSDWKLASFDVRSNNDRTSIFTRIMVLSRPGVTSTGMDSFADRVSIELEGTPYPLGDRRLNYRVMSSGPVFRLLYNQRVRGECSFLTLVTINSAGEVSTRKLNSLLFSLMSKGDLARKPAPEFVRLMDVIKGEVIVELREGGKKPFLVRIPRGKLGV